ncbi:type III secretion system chaperone [Roseovarius rhodophyticola]|uniref:Type III secretion system chaperone n=1 Tax=Roseovarius rhodophyticola TaxID=3080827 RepID=A0ABZ2TEV5_9RHOB|nr:type III secretion system chaperone [Roseovarius sp. W115]MDV2928470.1 type III secretion system chaperone [Roseovarius sp. W115]
MSRFLFTLAFIAFPLSVTAQEVEPDTNPEETAPEVQAESEAPMTLERLDVIVRALDPEAASDGRRWRLMIADVPVLIITDPNNDRMRALAPVEKVEDIEEGALKRMMQANFDSALDGRYAIANDMVWATYIHPLAALEKDQLISGLGQIINLSKTYGTLYSGGAMQFGGGDSGALQRELIDELSKKGQEI